MNNLDNTSSDKQKLDYYFSLMTVDEKHEPSSISTLDSLHNHFKFLLY